MRKCTASSPSILHPPHPHPLSLLQHLSFYAMPALTETIDQGRTRFISPIQLLTTVCLDFEPTSELDAILHFVCVGGKHASGAASKIDCREKKVSVKTQTRGKEIKAAGKVESQTTMLCVNSWKRESLHHEKNATSPEKINTSYWPMQKRNVKGK